MARTVEEIQNSIITSVQSDADLSGATSVSRRALWRLWTFIVATAQSVFEQLMSNEKSNIQSIVDASPAGSTYWVQQQMFKFQYDAVTPQILQLNTTTLAYEYPNVDITKRIITRCSVNRSIYNVVQIKVAKGTTPEALTSLEKSAAQDYITTRGVSGINYQVISLDADRLYIKGDIYYKGQYSAVIQANTIAAIDSYLSSLDFNGKVVLSDIEVAIKSVSGVTDCKLTDVAARGNATDFADKYYLAQNSTQYAINWQTVSGYVIQEDTSGETFSDTLNFIAA